MSRQLPPRPNLEHLRKQAKELLASLRQQQPTATLADAQHALARDYGFASWPKLKAFVEHTSPLAGMWVADVRHSRQHPLNRYQAAQMEISIAADECTIEDVVLDEAGRPERNRNVLIADGQPREANGYVMTARWADERSSLEVSVTRQGQVEGQVRYAVSADHQRLTITTREQVAIFERQPSHAGQR